MSTETYAKGDIVFATCEGSCPWPAKIIGSQYD